MDSPEKVLAKAEFIISVDSLLTGDPSRDAKINSSFFGLMNEPGSLTGRFVQGSGKPMLRIKMNGLSVDIPVETHFKSDTFVLEARVDLKDFDALKVLDDLNKVCFDLHKGADGVSKTWQEIDVTGTVLFRKKAQ